MNNETQLTMDTHAKSILFKLSEIEKWFGGLAAIKNLSFSVAKGEIFGIMGPNGAGKTTTLNIICGFLKPDRGNIYIEEHEITGKAPYEISRLGIARTYQNIQLFQGLSILETVVAGFYSHRSTTLWDAIFFTNRDRKERRAVNEEAKTLIEKVGIKADPKTIATTLSYGDQRRVEIARALAVKPKLLLLDEPTAGMNAGESELIGELFRKLKSEGITLIIIEHNMRMILNFCENGIVMNFGQLLAKGYPKQFVNNPEVQEAYFGKATDAKRFESIIKLRKH
jgi:branched-chain amino acid transport system ATP-binding protein